MYSFFRSELENLGTKLISTTSIKPSSNVGSWNLFLKKKKFFNMKYFSDTQLIIFIRPIILYSNTVYNHSQYKSLTEYSSITLSYGGTDICCWGTDKTCETFN